MQGRLIRTSTSKDYVLLPASVNFAIGGEQRRNELLVQMQPRMEMRKCPLVGCKLLECLALWKISQAAWGAGSSSELFTVK